MVSVCCRIHCGDNRISMAWCKVCKHKVSRAIMNPDRIDGIARIGGFMYPLVTTYLEIYSCVSKYMNHFPTLFLYSHLAFRHLVNTKLPVSLTIEMAHSDAAVQKASKENIVKKVNSLAWFCDWYTSNSIKYYNSQVTAINFLLNLAARKCSKIASENI